MEIKFSYNQDRRNDVVKLTFSSNREDIINTQVSVPLKTILRVIILCKRFVHEKLSNLELTVYINSNHSEKSQDTY